MCSSDLTGGPLAHRDAVRVMNEDSGSVARMAPTWIAALQAALHVPAEAATGALNEPTVQAVAVFQRDTMHAAPTGRLDDATVAALGQQVPALATGRMRATTAGVEGPWADDAAIQAQFRPGSFLGVDLGPAHPLLLDRLAAADAYLERQIGRAHV